MRREKEITGRTARHLAVLCLLRWDRERQAVQPHIDAVIHASSLSQQDRQLALLLVQGVLRHMPYLDAIVGGYSRFPPAKMKPLTLMVLRVAVFQLLFLDRIPESAAVNEAGRILQQERQPRWLINFANGVLRSIARSREDLVGSEAQDADGRLVLNHPDWLVQRWRNTFGEDHAVRICRANNREPNLVLRVNVLRATVEELAGRLRAAGFEVRSGRYAPDSLVLLSMTGPVSGLPGYDEGLFHVQDEAAQLVALLLSPLTPQHGILDACAGLGGKTCHLVQLLPPGGRLVAVEPNPYRRRLLADNLTRMRMRDKVELFQGGLEEFVRVASGLYSHILVDAPCSGTGVIGRHPDIRWNRRPEDLPAYQRQQSELLEHAATLLAPGGVLVYATCSLEPEENHQVVAAFLKNHAEFRMVDCRQFLPPAAADLVDTSGCFSPTPAQGLDGFFAARLLRSA